MDVAKGAIMVSLNAERGRLMRVVTGLQKLFTLSVIKSIIGFLEL